MPQSILDIVLRTKKEGQGVKQASKELGELKKGLAGAVENLTGFSIGSIGMAAAIAGVGTVVKRATDFTYEYSMQVKDLGRISGASAEDTSRLIQTTDDLGVEFGTLEQAAKALAKDGIPLTTEALARASDEYLGFTDAGDRAEYATRKFGKAGLELTKVLEKGGAAIRQMADEQTGALILTDDQVAQAEAYRQAQDNLNDTMDKFNVMVGSVTIPVLTGLIEGLTGAFNENEKMYASFNKASENAGKTATSIDDYRAKLVEAGYEVDHWGAIVVKTGMQNGQAVYRQVQSAADVQKAYDGIKKKSWRIWAIYLQMPPPGRAMAITC